MLTWKGVSKMSILQHTNPYYVQIISSQTVECNLPQREGTKDISDILRHLFSGKLKTILMCKLSYQKKINWNL